MTDPMIALALSGAGHLRGQATLHRGWAEGLLARGADRAAREIMRRMDQAEHFEHWAAAIEALAERQNIPPRDPAMAADAEMGGCMS